MNRARLLLADEHTLMLDGLCRLLASEFDVVGTCTDGQSLVHAAEQLHPAVVLLDILMPLLNGLDAAAQLRKLVPAARLIFVTMHDDPAYVREAFRIGATGYVIKRCAADELIEAVRAVLQGRTYVTPMLHCGTAGLHEQSTGGLQPCGTLLTARQRQVLQLVAEGHPDKEIAALLHVSDKTVEFHKASIRRQLGLRSAADMTRFAIKHGLTTS